MISSRSLRSLSLALTLTAAALVPARTWAEIQLPPGFTAKLYVTGEGFETTGGAGGRGIPTTPTLAVDPTGALYLARGGRRYSAGEFDYLQRMYRIPPGGARVTPATEERYFHGPPLINAQVMGARGGRELLVSTFDRDRRVGVLYRLANGRIQLFAGGTPERGLPPALVQPEGAAVDTAGNLLDAGYVRVTRPRALAVDEADHLWIGSDGTAEAPWQPGPGEIWRVSPGGERRLVLEGPMAQGLAPGPGGVVFVADRQKGEIFAVSPDGTRMNLARFTEGDAPRGLTFVPITAETRAGGLAGDLLVAVTRSGSFQLNDIVRISGPFADLSQSRLGATG